MNQQTLRNILEHTETWPEEDRKELAEYARVIEARRTGLYRLNDAERSAVLEGLEEADQGEYASAEMLAESVKRYGG